MASRNLIFRREVLRGLGADPWQVEALLAYNKNQFAIEALSPPVMLPIDDEASVQVWCDYAHGTATSAATVLKAHFPQLNFPLCVGMSEHSEYRRATRSGAPWSGMAAATGLALCRPEGIEIFIHPTVAGHIPILIARDRMDFESLLCAFLHRNEPKAVPASMGAAMIAGFNNWSRLAGLRAAFEAAHSPADWPTEFARIKPLRHLYQDRFILVSDNPYSGVALASSDVSLTMRYEHEAAHYITRRLLGSMRNNLLDELIADYAGMVAATGAFRGDWFLRFMGLEEYPIYREGGRFQNYLNDPPVPPDCVPLLRTLLVQAVKRLAAFDSANDERLRSPRRRALMLLALCRLTLEELASDCADALLNQALERTCADFQFKQP